MTTAVEKWKSITQSPQIVQFFAGLFDRAGVHVTDTGEEFTCSHDGDHITFTPGLDRSGVDYVVDVPAAKVDRLVENTKAAQIDEVEQYRVIAALFTPATEAMLKNPIMSNNVLRRLAGVEDLIHVHLVPPTPEEQEVSHTLIYAHDQWLVLPGLVGNPARTYRLTLQDALTYQKRVSSAMKTDRLSEWTRFGQWYREWRQGVSTTH